MSSCICMLAVGWHLDLNGYGCVAFLDFWIQQWGSHINKYTSVDHIVVHMHRCVLCSEWPYECVGVCVWSLEWEVHTRLYHNVFVHVHICISPSDVTNLYHWLHGQHNCLHHSNCSVGYKRLKRCLSGNLSDHL